jgi:hypothetical protein
MASSIIPEAISPMNELREEGAV